jgi:hypothetical protein
VDWVREEQRIQVRLAVNTGEALITLGARPAEGEGMAAGDVLNTAARLQAAAPVNGILAEALGLDEVRASVLITNGMGRTLSGDPQGTADLQRGLEIALAGNFPTSAVRGYSNLSHAAQSVDGDLAEGLRLALEAEQVAQRFGTRALLRWARGALIGLWFELETGTGVPVPQTSSWPSPPRTARTITTLTSGALVPGCGWPAAMRKPPRRPG